MRPGWRQPTLLPVSTRSRCLGHFFSPSKHEMRLKEVHAGFRPALLKHAPCSLPTEAGPTLFRSSLCIFGAQKVSHLLFHLQFRYEDLTTTLQDWGAKVRAVHIAGSYWAPGFANYLILLQVFYQQAKSQLIELKCRQRTFSLTT